MQRDIISRREPARAERVRPDDTDRGTTLVEVAITIALIGIAVVPVMSAVQAGIRASSSSRAVAQTETVLVNAVDRVNRADRGDFPCDLTSPVTAAVETAGWPAANVTVGHAYLDATGNWATDPSGTGCPGGVFQSGVVQRISITVTHPSGNVTRTVEVVKGDV